MQKPFILSLIALLLLSTLLFASEQPDLQQHSSCHYCGMNRLKFAQSRMLIDYADGSTVAVCSLHCAAIEFALSIDKSQTAIAVGDFNSQQLIDAVQAFWVIGGEKSGVMTSRGKWAFSDATAAAQFIALNGGVMVDFDHAMRAAFEDMYKDTQMIRNKRKMKQLKMDPSQQKKE